MAFDPAPTEIFANWSEDGTDITLPLASVPGLTAGEADAVSGDNREVCRALCEQIFQWYNALETADRPTKMTVQRATTPFGDELIQTYTLQFTNAITSQNVAAES